MYHAVAVLYAPAYQAENAGALRHDWPRIPLPRAEAVFRVSATHGRNVTLILDVATAAVGITAGTIRPELRPIASLTPVDGCTLDPDAGDLDISADWGRTDKQGAVMPGRGKAIERDYTPAERSAIDEGLIGIGLSPGEVMGCLGPTTFDVYLSDHACWANIPAHVWTFKIGGYQVMKKWLSYREYDVLGRPLTANEARFVSQMARRIAAILLLQPSLDVNYDFIKGDLERWHVSDERAETQKVSERAACTAPTLERTAPAIPDATRLSLPR